MEKRIKYHILAIDNTITSLHHITEFCFRKIFFCLFTNIYFQKKAPTKYT